MSARLSRAFPVPLLALTLGALPLASCAPGPLAPVTAEERLAAYSRVDRVIGPAHLLKPVDDPELSPAYLLAPLIVHELNDPGETAPFGHVADSRVRRDEPTVYVHRADGERTRWTYAWWYPGDPPRMRGVRMTLGADGFPAVYELLDDSSRVRLLVVEQGLDTAAAATHGSPLPGRSFAVEPAVEDAPDVVVLEAVEPGPTPLGPFVYLTPDAREMVGLHCRCSPTRMASVANSFEYRLVRLDTLPADWPLPEEPPEAYLRLPLPDATEALGVRSCFDSTADS